MSTDAGYFDHVAIAVERWSDGFDWFVRELGGRWVRGGDGGEFAPCQLGFAGGDLKVELMQPGGDAGGFVRRFLARGGPGPHHLTFKVPDVPAFAAAALAEGLPLLGDFLNLPWRQEVFIHPRQPGFGTLVQAMQITDVDLDTPAPEDFPAPGGGDHAVAWVALAVTDVDRAAGFLTTATAAVSARACGPGTLLAWAGERRLLLLPAGGSVRPGVSHIAFRAASGPERDPAAVLAGEPTGTERLGTKVIVYQ